MLKALEMSTSKTLCLPLLVIILFNHGLLSKGSADVLNGRKYYGKELPVKTITIDDGDIYDCMKIDSHPSMRVSSIKRKKQLRGKFSQQGTIRTANSSHESTNDKLRNRTVEPESGSCPPGSVAVLKATKGGPLNFSAIEEFASLRARSFLKSKSMKPLVDTNPSEREYAQASVKGGRYRGAEGTLSVWQPTVEHNFEISVSQIWVLHEVGDDLSMSLEAGWMVNPSLYGDRRTRFFIFTTKDDYETWLYNDNRRNPSNNGLRFRRVNNYLPFGQQLESSVVDGDATEIEITIKQNDNRDWELWVDETLIGSWPKSNYRVRHANRVIWGGEVVNRETYGRHTSTQMGSGHFASEPIGRVAYISHMGLYNTNLERYDAPQAMNVDVDQPDCYDLKYWQGDEDYGQHITFGGPGFDGEDCT